ncbi:MAG: hypothetical protein KDA74_16880, partial [Planctomycetaceae bacterium]|nr:hypothetical protein [Planctomycetaceae bacterium]
GHRNMEGETAFVQDLKERDSQLLSDNNTIAYRYSIGGGYKKSAEWEPLGPAGYYDTFGPELSFAAALQSNAGPGSNNIAIAKFTHSGSQMNDWTPQGSMAATRHLYPGFIEFIRESVRELQDRGHEVEVAGIFYHAGENDMSMPPYRREAAAWLVSTVRQSRIDLCLPKLRWFISQQPPTDHESVNSINVTGDLEQLAAADRHVTHIKAFDLPPQPRQLVLDTTGIVHLGQLMAVSFLRQDQSDRSAE